MKRHAFWGVAGHADDDECTHREDGTDATYCGEPQDAQIHQDSGGLCDYDANGLMCTRLVRHEGECILVPESQASIAPDHRWGDSPVAPISETGDDRA